MRRHSITDEQAYVESEVFFEKKRCRQACTYPFVGKCGYVKMNVVLVTVNWREIACSDAFAADIINNRILLY